MVDVGAQASGGLACGVVVDRRADVDGLGAGLHGGDTAPRGFIGHHGRPFRLARDCADREHTAGIAGVKRGATTGDIGAAIQQYAEGERTSVVRDFCGHGLGRVFHDVPNILHYGRPGEGLELKAGMFFTIEPMINLGRPHVKILSDGWTAVTRDRSMSAQFEHTVGVTPDGCEVFTYSPKGLHHPPYAIAD